MASFALRRYARAYTQNIGGATVTGTVRVGTTPVSRPVYLLEQEAMQLIRETASASDGSYSFTNMEAGKRYMVMAVDPTGASSAVVSDRVTP